MPSHSAVGPRTRTIVYRNSSRPSDELSLFSLVDRAHLVMLAETGIVPRAAAGGVLRRIEQLRATDFAELHSLPAPRGIYLMYESFLVEELGAHTGGVLHTARSRNDLNATTAKLRLRSWVLDYLAEANRLAGVLLARARAHRDAIMAIYTHYQRAMPTTYGHYLLGHACVLGRTLADLLAATADLGTCPLGAGAVGGTDLPINNALTAELLGFDRPATHALDAVAGRDTHLRVLGSVAELTVALSRLASDLQLWSTPDFDLVAFPQRLTGGSSAMPQKRNVFPLEHMKAKAPIVIGAWAAAAGTMANTPFTNSIEVGTEAVAAMAPGLEAARDAVLLGQVLVSGARPRIGRMTDGARSGFITATAVANGLVRGGIPFRAAHGIVADAVRAAVARGSDSLGELEFGPWAAVDVNPDPPVDSCVASFRHGGGPGSFDECLRQCVDGWRARGATLAARRAKADAADAALDDAVARLMAAS
jgi:argininosuccinate lyase